MPNSNTYTACKLTLAGTLTGCGRVCAEYLRFSGPVPARAHLAAPSPTAARAHVTAQGVFRFQLREDMAKRRYKLTSSEMELVFRMVSHRASLSFLIMAGSKAWAGSLQLLPLVFPMNT
jgi:hypothetical protein